MENLTQLEWKEGISKDKDSIVIDVRTKEECLHGMIENAIHLDICDLENFTSEVEKMDKSKNYFVYCMAGGRSGSACKIMNDLGFENTYNLMGGISCWTGDTVDYAE